jgi:hypothetical protein
VAAAADRPEHTQALADRISHYTASDARTLRGLGELLRLPAPDPRVVRILPLVPLPIDLVYAILERKAAPSSAK